MKKENELPRASGIYKITCLLSEKVYVGSAVDMKSRKNIHLHHLRNSKHHSKHLQRAFHKHGELNFKFSVLELVESKGDLIKREQYYIDLLKSFDSKCGFNTNPIAGSRLGAKLSKEAKDKIGKSKIGRKMSPESIRKNIESRAWYSHSDETRKKMSSAKKGIVFTQQHRENIRLNNGATGKPAHNRGVSITEETRLKIKESLKKAEKQTCVHCGFVATPSKIARWHNDFCLKNPNIDIEKEKQRRKTKESIRLKMGLAISKAMESEDYKAKRKQVYEKSPILTCPHCGYESKNAGNMYKSHFDNCLKNPNVDLEAIQRVKEEAKIKAKITKEKNKTLITCPHCNKSSYNKGNMMLNHFDRCRANPNGTPRPVKVYIKKEKKLYTCNHCGFQSYKLGSMNRWHFDNCKNKNS
jgi:group I intron endonuclease